MNKKHLIYFAVAVAAGYFAAQKAAASNSFAASVYNFGASKAS